MNHKDYVDVLSALLTPFIAIITTYIAYQNYRNAKLKLRHELYDKRLQRHSLECDRGAGVRCELCEPTP